MFVEHHFRKNMNDVRPLPGADIDSDHNLLISKIHEENYDIPKVKTK
jgi:hypothetical protein